MKTKLLLIASVFLLATALPAQADIFKCVGSDGHVTYSNLGDKNCKRLSLEPVPASAPAAKSAAKAPTPAGFPKVEENAQKSRDNDRRRILEGELAAEQRNLEQARKELAEQQDTVLPNERMQYKTGGGINGAKVEERVQPFRDKVALHERNIEAIQSELSRLR